MFSVTKLAVEDRDIPSTRHLLWTREKKRLKLLLDKPGQVLRVPGGGGSQKF
jgi:hypothetical protein